MTFQEESRLEKIGEVCFRVTALEQFATPPGLKEIGGGTLQGCRRLKRLVLSEGLEALTAN